jgi:hypothetical protein
MMVTKKQLEERLFFDDMKVLSDELGLTINETIVGYLRQPITYNGECIKGVCGINKSKCSYAPPHSCYECPVYKKNVLGE